MSPHPGCSPRTIFVTILVILLGVAPLGCGKPAPIVVGGLVSETGAASAYGVEIRRGMDLALEEENVQGGFPDGRALVIDYRDDGSSPEKARAAMAELLQQRRVNVVLGGVSSSVAEAVIPQIVEREAVLLSPSASAPALTAQGGGWFFRTYPSDMLEVEEVAGIAHTLDVKRVAILAYDSAFGKSLADIFANQMEAQKAKVPLVAVFGAPIGAPEATRIAKEVVEAKVDGVYLAGYINEVAALLQALAGAGFKGVKLASSAVTPEIIRMTGAASERLVFPQARVELEGADPQVKAFAASYKQKYNAPPQVWAAYGYDTVKVFADALRRTRVATAGEIRANLVNINHKGVTGPINFDTRGDVRRDPHLFAVVRGEMMHFESADPSIRGMLAQ